MNINKKSAYAALALAGLLVGAALAAAPSTRAQYVMGTVCEITAYGDGAVRGMDEAFMEIQRWDRLLSLYKQDSEASRLNRSAGSWFPCSEGLWEQIGEALRYARDSNGAFDPTVLPLLKNGPAALPLVGYAKVELDEPGRRVKLAPGMGLDFGGIAKGLALDHAAAKLRAAGVTAALLNFGGQLLAVGAPPGQAGWPATIEGSTQTFLLKDASLSTSGNAEHPGHIVSPFSGLRMSAEPSVSVIARTATEADAWSTALFVLGPSAKSRFAGCILFAGTGASPFGNCTQYLNSKKEKRS